MKIRGSKIFLYSYQCKNSPTPFFSKGCSYTSSAFLEKWILIWKQRFFAIQRYKMTSSFQYRVPTQPLSIMSLTNLNLHNLEMIAHKFISLQNFNPWIYLPCTRTTEAPLLYMFSILCYLDLVHTFSTSV